MSDCQKDVCGFGVIFANEDGAFVAQNSGNRKDAEQLQKFGGLIYAVIASVYGAEKLGADALTIYCQDAGTVDKIINHADNCQLLDRLHHYLDKMQEKIAISFACYDDTEVSRQHFLHSELLAKGESMKLIQKSKKHSHRFERG